MASSRPKGSSGRRRPSMRAPAALAPLLRDHREIQALFRVHAAGIADPAERESVVRGTCELLLAHAELEEQVFYPTLEQRLPDTALLDEALVEHEVARRLIDQLVRMRPSDVLYDATFQVLGEYVNHHIEAEEHALFAQLRRSGVDLAALGEALRLQREQLRAEHGLPEVRRRPAIAKRAAVRVSASGRRQRQPARAPHAGR